MVQILNFLKDQEMNGISWTRQKDLKTWFRKRKGSPTMLHDLLKKLVSYGFVVRAENPEGLQGVFYGLPSKLREEWMEKFQRLKERVAGIHELPKAERKKQLRILIEETMDIGKSFVPFILVYAILYDEDIEDEDALEKWIRNYFRFFFFPHLFETIKACSRDMEVAFRVLGKVTKIKHTIFLQS